MVLNQPMSGISQHYKMKRALIFWGLYQDGKILTVMPKDWHTKVDIETMIGKILTHKFEGIF